eukprot:COSAG04_NODE_399_length_14959_cov_28.238730_11_plen_295_part_00
MKAFLVALGVVGVENPQACLQEAIESLPTAEPEPKAAAEPEAVAEPEAEPEAAAEPEAPELVRGQRYRFSAHAGAYDETISRHNRHPFLRPGATEVGLFHEMHTVHGVQVAVMHVLGVSPAPDETGFHFFADPATVTALEAAAAAEPDDLPDLILSSSSSSSSEQGYQIFSAFIEFKARLVHPGHPDWTEDYAGTDIFHHAHLAEASGGRDGFRTGGPLVAAENVELARDALQRSFLGGDDQFKRFFLSHQSAADAHFHTLSDAELEGLSFSDLTINSFAGLGSDGCVELCDIT